MAGNKTMRAVQYNSYGGGAAALKHVDDVPIPSPNQGEVLLKLEATSLNPVDWKIQKGLNGGGIAEYAVAPLSVTVSRPLEVSSVDGAGLPTASLTALQALKVFGITLDGTGKIINVLITAASNGVGQYPVQLPKLANLHVTATYGVRNIEFVERLGADEVLDYKTPEGASFKGPLGRKFCPWTIIARLRKEKWHC